MEKGGIVFKSFMTNNLSIDLKKQLLFSYASGDFNPIHIDKIYARRSMYGQNVVHGINLLLLSLDFFSVNKSFFQIINIDVKFLKPVFLNTSFEICILKKSNYNAKIEINSQNKICAQIEFDYCVDDYFKNYNSKNKIKPEERQPVEIKNFSENLKGKDFLKFDLNILSILYPNLLLSTNLYSIINFLSLTRIVGMKCPGLNSLFSSFSLTFIKNIELDDSIKYIVKNFDERFNLFKISINSLNCKGDIVAFNRPKPVSQTSYLYIKEKIEISEFKNQKALIIGGSRGLGELAAKILAAGGADVTITHNQGSFDSTRIVDEIKKNGGKCESIFFDVLNFKSAFDYGFKSNSFPTHIYYFASPFIFSGDKSKFSHELLNKFNHFYVSAFYNIAQNFINLGTNNFFYPSTVATQEYIFDMMEYSFAKLSGEKLCDFLEIKYPKLNIYKPNLPRLSTDQTVSLLPVNNKKPDNLILNHIRKFTK